MAKSEEVKEVKVVAPKPAPVDTTAWFTGK
jgi:hypothetical protein